MSKTSFPTRITKRYLRHDLDRISQGDILRDVHFFEVGPPNDVGKRDVSKLDFLYGVVLSQECDLEHDFTQREETAKAGDAARSHDKHLHTILLLPAFPEDSFKQGKHLEMFDFKRESKNSEQMKRIKQQNEARYHYLPADPDLQVQALVIDFKLSFTVPHGEAYHNMRGRYLATLNELFREQLSHRFAAYLARVGTPEFEGAAAPPPAATAPAAKQPPTLPPG